ncbi:MAG: hemerythrin family protein [Woeseiaceae bacterium]|nr:hemerythrin family protein [Woeseiaceae bacterium]
MTLIEWKDEFNVGVAEVDYEHRELVALINALHDDMGTGAGRDDIIRSLGEIYAQISAHFALEEKFMRESRYMAYAEHKEDHEILLDDLRDIMDKVEDDGSYGEARLSSDLGYWFSEHFRTHDARLHRHARKDA